MKNMAEINTNPATPAVTVPTQPTSVAVPDMNAATNQINATTANTASSRQLPDGLFTNNTNANQDGTNTKAADMRLPFLTRKAQAGVSLLELCSAVPLLFSSLISQADTIIAEEDGHPNSRLIGFIATSIKSLSSLFKWSFDRFVPKAKDENDVTVNKHPFMFDAILSRISQPTFVRQVTSFIFAMRRALFSFFPNVFTVPAEEHDPTKPSGGTASGFSTAVFRGASAVLSPFRVVSSLITAVFALPSNAFGALFAYTGDQKPFNFTNFTSTVSDAMLPVTTNLNSLYKVTKAYFDSWSSKNMHLGLTFDRYNINFLHVIQGVFGSILSVPYFFGALAKTKTILVEKDANDHYLLANQARDFVGAVALELQSLGWLRGNIATTQERVQSSISKSLDYVQDFSNQSLTKLMNANSMFKSFFSQFRPVDLSGTVLPGDSPEVVESSNLKDNYVFNVFKKSGFFGDMFDILHPIQSALMLLPNAFVGISDDYVQDNGTRSLRWLDRLVGVNSAILSLPNYLIYVLKTRVPQILIKWYEIKQRKADIEGRDYDAYQDFNNLIEKLYKIALPGSKYTARTLEDLDLRVSDFRNPMSIQSKFKKLDKEATKHEHSVKASELVMAMRIGMRHVIGTGSKLFFTERDPETGFTAEEQSRDKVYNAMGTFSTSIRGLPVIGWIGAPIIETFRSMYKVKPVANRKKLQIANKPTGMAA